MGGGDKPLLFLHGQSLLARILATLSLDHAHIAISANGDPARLGTTLPVLADQQPGQGPLAGGVARRGGAAGVGPPC